MSTFQGLPRGLFEFFTELQAGNSKAFWQTKGQRIRSRPPLGDTPLIIRASTT